LSGFIHETPDEEAVRTWSAGLQSGFRLHLEVERM